MTHLLDTELQDLPVLTPPQGVWQNVQKRVHSKWVMLRRWLPVAIAASLFLLVSLVAILNRNHSAPESNELQRLLVQSEHIERVVQETPHVVPVISETQLVLLNHVALIDTQLAMLNAANTERKKKLLQSRIDALKGYRVLQEKRNAVALQQASF